MLFDVSGQLHCNLCPYKQTMVFDVSGQLHCILCPYKHTMVFYVSGQLHCIVCPYKHTIVFDAAAAAPWNLHYTDWNKMRIVHNLIYVTCLGGESGSTDIQEHVATSYKRKLLFTGRY